MFKFKNGIVLLTVVSIISIGLPVYLLGGINSELIQAWLKSTGIWSPIIYRNPV